MNLYLLNPALERISVIEKFISLIWTDRVDEYGDFEMFVPVTSSNLSLFQIGCYITNSLSEHIMVIESAEIKSDIEEGDSLCIQGRSIEIILFYRIVWSQTLLSGNLQSEVQRILNENAISPTITDRAITRLIFSVSTDIAVTSLIVEGQYTGTYLYDVISGICKAAGLGFKITINSSAQFVFSLYSGVDRSYDQIINDYVTFSPNFENLVNSNYFTSTVNLRTVALVAGEGEGTERLTTTCVDGSGGGSDLTRREIYVDARDLSKTTDSGTLLDVDYLIQLAQRGTEVLADNILINHFEGEIDITNMFMYGVDFFIGDIVQMSNQYGQGGRSRVTEFIISQDTNGITTHPTFKSLD